MQLSKILFTTGLLILGIAVSGAAQSDKSKPEGVIIVQPDSLKASSRQAEPDTIRVPANCTPKMPTMKFSGPWPVEMPKMPIDEELTSRMPIMGQDCSCIEKEQPQK